ncbi:Mini-ribonuclease 3 [Salsuginibacillus kocurii]|uniref:Mini-ribonuclease 3 n=1 Tax=Salsuginibacillus kocurii TaxID=427078 RepID=UPI0003752D97|nr:ribonuclease III domain-containing protein [Salsuginibacillus kocurii]
MKHEEMKVDPHQMNALALAYVGDAVFDLFIRRLIISKGTVKPNQFHKEATKYVTAPAQAAAAHALIENNDLMTEEQAVLRRGRNAKSGTVPRSTDVTTYRYSTAFEALVGFLYLLQREERLQKIMELAVDSIELAQEREDS